MNSSKVFDDVICYLEKIARSDCEIDYNEISKLQ
jgi:AraC family transcriptional regulator